MGRSFAALAALAAVAAAPQKAFAVPDSDAISSIPDYGVPKYPQYSGYLDASAARDGAKLHYWFAQEESDDWKSKPLVLWLNGGPGSSSMIGFLQENGPLLVGTADADKFMFENPYAWTKLANLVAIESPVGVGYSYCKEMLTGGSCSNDDVRTAQATHAALQDFVTSKFPELAKNEFFITGESYAGVYCPTLAKEILDANDRGETNVNLVGMAVGDPCTDNDAQADSMDMLWYGHKHGFVPDDEFDLLWNQCGARHSRAEAAGAWEVNSVTGKFGAVEGAQQPWHTTSKTPLTPRKTLVGQSDGPSKEDCELANRKFLMTTSKGFDQEWLNGFINDVSLFGPFAIVGSQAKGSLNYRIAQWMMRDDVKKALHVDVAPVSVWPGPGDGWTYASNYSACNPDAPKGAWSMIDFYKNIAPRVGGNVLVFNGDTDPCVSYEGTRQAIKEVGFSEVTGAPYRPWFFNATSDSDTLLQAKDLLYGPTLSTIASGPQLGGLVVDYDNGLSFCTVHGSGHMVPQFRPRAALRMIDSVLTSTPLSPHTATDKELVAMDDKAYNEWLDKWTLSAKAGSDVSA